MRYPQMGRNRKYTLNVPDFSGGINASKPAQDIQDNQAASISNMWLKDGVLQTRPAFKHGSDNAYFLSAYGLKDLGVEVKLGYETYSADDTAQGDAVQHTYRLFYSGTKEFLLFDIEAKSFTNVELDFQKDVYEACFSEGKAEYEFFYTNGLADFSLYLDSGYMQTFCTEIYGFMKLNECASLEGKAIILLLYLKPYVEGGNVKLKLEIYNAVKDLPAEHVPYCPTVALDYGEAYAETLDDFNLMSGSFMVDYNIHKSTTQFSGDAIAHIKETVDKGLGDGAAQYGNFDAWDELSFTLPFTDVGYLSEVTVYGEFQFYEFECDTWDDDYLKSWDSENYQKYSWQIPKDKAYVERTVTDEHKKATTLKIKPSGEKLICTFYNDNGDAVSPGIVTNGGEDGKYRACCSNATASLSNDFLTVRLPAAQAEITVPGLDDEFVSGGSLPGSGTTYYYVKAQSKTVKTASIYIEQVKVVMNTREGGDVEYWDKQNSSELITKNTISTWYGGTNSGYTGGTRLFVAGHPEFKNVIRWSGVNDSSYFLENNFAYVGRDDEAITALNKQDGYLVVFKEHELYALEYTYTTDEKNGTIVYFPIKPISPYIGCDCPDTIQFIANRLTWLTSDGKVYTLFSENSYSERNVREVSKHIENELKKHSREELQSAKSVDYAGNYLILVGKSVYLWNYDLNPYYNYTSSEKAQKSLCWFKWELPHNVEYVYTVNGELVVICRSDNDAEYQGYVLDYSDSTDELIGGDTQSIDTFYKSKLWDFGNPFAFKKINRAFFELEAASGEIQVRFYTENGTDEITVRLDTRYSGNKAFNTRPHLVRVRSAGFELESKAAVKLYSAAISAETYGEVK